MATAKRSVFDVDDYVWPNLWREADDMLQASLLIYPFTKLRQLAREGKLKGTDNVLTLPVTAKCALEMIKDNVDSLKDQMEDEDIQMCLGALKSMNERHQKSMEAQSKQSNGMLKSALTFLSDKVKMINGETFYADTTLVAFGDQDHENELVYAVGIDNVHKRITVCFRGSVTQADFITDAWIQMQSKLNPLAGCSDQENTVKIHCGFFTYLLGRPEKDSAGVATRSGGSNKFEEIMNHVVNLIHDYPNYKLYVTGHSLGGALATLFSFEAANYTTVPLPKPITCISVASPKVGDESFRKAFKLLEEQGKVRHLRIANENDPVTQGPPASAKGTLAALSPAVLSLSYMMNSDFHTEIYKHVGIKLLLYPETNSSKFNISYSEGKWNEDTLSPFAITSISNHYGYSYSTRLLALMNDLEKMYVNDLYTMKNKNTILQG
eukprot:CAMPEP_0195512536 /NCGR_PEP_ID=MMETSP0794_2-20130614/4461_1 /TAXON_ID=515487 /ORGANISM="Stephanopyxis turris, Strain CCMP 815" /LENGTH=436 /DNA_ID=CAMNT_0040640341 /DNA_START=27 /DNA_END=1337 /DNA_ORIENTATION=+